ncbi:uncharacterized protein LOC125189987 [Salvia hispanica]|uniref:uncharacterized protein LOC125189987 n=1 Tax=Salvia hispanica TaxID=49212 RepID=UPI0020096ECA|nr:uncharacterized protein LOC125189987 [Salvia hispanica]
MVLSHGHLHLSPAGEVTTSQRPPLYHLCAVEGGHLPTVTCEDLITKAIIYTSSWIHFKIRPRNYLVYLTSKTSPNQNYYGPTLSPINTRPSSSRLLSDQIPSLTNLVSLSFLRFLLRPWHHRWRRRLPLAICLSYLSITAIAAISLPSINTTAIQRLRPLPPWLSTVVVATACGGNTAFCPRRIYSTPLWPAPPSRNHIVKLSLSGLARRSCRPLTAGVPSLERHAGNPELKEDLVVTRRCIGRAFHLHISDFYLYALGYFNSRVEIYDFVVYYFAWVKVRRNAFISYKSH